MTSQRDSNALEFLSLHAFNAMFDCLPCLGSVLSLLESLKDEAVLFGDVVSITESF